MAGQDNVVRFRMGRTPLHLYVPMSLSRPQPAVSITDARLRKELTIVGEIRRYCT